MSEIRETSEMSEVSGMFEAATIVTAAQCYLYFSRFRVNIYDLSITSLLYSLCPTLAPYPSPEQMSTSAKRQSCEVSRCCRYQLLRIMIMVDPLREFVEG
jgi:hypothetical protein